MPLIFHVLDIPMSLSVSAPAWMCDPNRFASTKCLVLQQTLRQGRFGSGRQCQAGDWILMPSFSPHSGKTSIDSAEQVIRAEEPVGAEQGCQGLA